MTHYHGHNTYLYRQPGSLCKYGLSHQPVVELSHVVVSQVNTPHERSAAAGTPGGSGRSRSSKREACHRPKGNGDPGHHKTNTRENDAWKLVAPVMQLWAMLGCCEANLRAG